MPFQYVRVPLTADESDRLANSCVTTNERLVLWAWLDPGVRVAALGDLTSKDVLGPQPPRRVKVLHRVETPFVIDAPSPPAIDRFGISSASPGETP
jgi:hypothetical protein